MSGDPGRPDAARGPARVLVADDQTVVREGLVVLLDLLPGIEVVGAAADGAEAVRLTGELRPDVVLMDLRMPTLDGVGATRLIRRDHPSTHVVVLTTYADDASVLGALRAGALGYLTKDADPDEIARAVATVRGGAALFDPAVQRRLAQTVSAEGAPDGPAVGDATLAGAAAHGAGPGTDVATSRTPTVPDGLTPREVEVLELIAAGRTNAEIAAALHVSEATVKTHINNLFAKAGLRDRAQAVAYAFRHGLAAPDA